MFIWDWIKKFISDSGHQFSRRLKKFVLSVPFWVIVIAVVLIASMSIRSFMILNVRNENKMYEYWQGDSDIKFRQMSCYSRGSSPYGSDAPMFYIDSESSMMRSDLAAIRASIQSKVNSSYPSFESRSKKASDGTPVGWVDAYSTSFNAMVSYYNSDNKPSTPSEISVVAVGGDFRVFHPFEYLSGGFLPEVCTDNNQIVINDYLAWSCFSSYDVLGKKINMFGQDFTIIGVVAETKSKADETSGNQVARAYVYFSGIEAIVNSGYFDSSSSSSETSSYSGALTNSDSASTTAATTTAATTAATNAESLAAPTLNSNSAGDSSIAITCYEAIIPEKISGVAVSDFSEALNYSAESPKKYIVSGNGRYNVFKIFDFMLPLGETEEKLAGISFPYWEKAAQLTIQYLFVNVICIIFGVALLTVGVVAAILRRKKFASENIVNVPEDDDFSDDDDGDSLGKITVRRV